MKQFNALFIFSLICSILLLFTSCDPESETPVPGIPSVTIEGDEIEDNTFTGSPGDIVNATINVQAPSGFNTLIIRKFINGTEESGSTERITRGAGTTPPTTFSHDFEYELQPNDVEDEVYFTFEAVDENNASGTATLTIEATALPAARYTSILLYAPLENNDSETFFSSNTGETYTMNEINNSTEPLSANVDFGYFYGQEFDASLAAPSSYPLPDYGQANWIVRNETQIARTSITPGQYTEITEDNIQAIRQAFDDAEFGPNPNLVRNLTVGEILAFETDNTKTGGSKRGLIQVQSIEPGIGEEGSIQIEVLVEQ